MRSVLRFVAVLLCVPVAGMVAVASAQKGKPVPVTYTWQAELAGTEPQFLELSQPAMPSGGSIYVGAGYTPANRKVSGYSQFILRVHGGNVSTDPWMRFKDLITTSYAGTLRCNFPEFGVDDLLLPSSRMASAPDCLTGFLSGHRLPQAPYWMTQLGLRIPDLDIFAIEPGHSTASALAHLDVFVTDNSGPDAYSRIGNDPSPMPGEVIVSRSGDGNSWTTRINIPLRLAEVYYVQDEKGRTQTVIPQVADTENVLGTITWTRRIAG